MSDSDPARGSRRVGGFGPVEADSGSSGLPSEIVDDPLLSLVSPEEEDYQNAEERRIMYVAMTRARDKLTILASNARPSSLVAELRKDPLASEELV